MATHDPELRKELDATLQTRKELGPEYESELVESFLEKLDTTVDQRVRRQFAEQQMQVARGAQPPRPRSAPGGGGGYAERFGFATVSLVLAVPLSAIGSANAGLTGLIVSWAGIVAVNAVHASGFFKRPRQDRKRDEDGWD
ncbi:hypothetical protein CP973_05285 [Streptomyces albofaciens JCM 4342]|uniref:hypothetical protein n=1 Tax=Streptomyces albofaciens TaxID=66866 RepID=UPI00123B5B09|nr:hypothetical protein [Streptomyces albofaciens]KAA6221465.1 hypothetical protein CP973_05285 [Streptomyces albofaciens JCM 4342]